MKQRTAGYGEVDIHSAIESVLIGIPLAVVEHCQGNGFCPAALCSIEGGVGEIGVAGVIVADGAIVEGEGDGAGVAVSDIARSTQLPSRIDVDDAVAIRVRHSHFTVDGPDIIEMNRGLGIGAHGDVGRIRGEVGVDGKSGFVSGAGGNVDLVITAPGVS